MELSNYSDIYEFLIRQMRLIHAPVGIKFFFDEHELEAFRRKGGYSMPIKPVTFCQAELGARMGETTILLEMKKLWCTDARCVFAVDPISDEIVNDLCKFSVDIEQARRMAESKPRFDRPALAVAFIPLKDVEDTPDIVHFCCDNLQAYHIVDDWMAVRDIYPFRPALSVNSAVCGGAAFSFLQQQANMTLACAGSYNSGKMERGEINVFIPGADFPAVVKRMADRLATTGGVSLTRKGHPFPGADICQNCPVIVYKPAERS